MIIKIYTIKAYFQKYDEINKKMTLLFLDDEIEPFTKSFLTKYYSSAQNNPVKYNEFYVKIDARKSICYLDKASQIIVPIQDNLDKVVIMDITIKHYNFTNNFGKKIIGWNIHLINMKPAA